MQWGGQATAVEWDGTATGGALGNETFSTSNVRGWKVELTHSLDYVG